MREGKIADDVVAGWLTELRTRPLYAGLSTGDPFAVMDPLALEVGGAVYARPALTLIDIGPRLVRNLTALTWPALPPLTHITHVVAWSSPTNGALIFSSPLPGQGVSLPAGGTWTLPARELYVGFPD